MIDPGYVEETKSKVAEVFGGKDKEKIYKEICEMLKDDKMVNTFKYNIFYFSF